MSKPLTTATSSYARTHHTTNSKEGGVWKPFKAIGQIIAYYYNVCISSWTALTTYWSRSVQQATEEGTTRIDQAGNYVQRSIIYVINRIQRFWLNILTGIYDFFANLFGVFWDFITLVVRSVVELVVGFFMATFAAIGNATLNFYNGVIDFVHGTITFMVELVKGFTHGIKYGIKNTIYLIKTAMLSVLNGIKDAIMFVINSIITIMAGTFTGLAAVVVAVVISIQSFFVTIFNFIKVRIIE